LSTNIWTFFNSIIVESEVLKSAGNVPVRK